MQLSLPMVAVLAAAAVLLLRGKADESLVLTGMEAENQGLAANPGGPAPRSKGPSPKRGAGRRGSSGKGQETKGGSRGQDGAEQTESEDESVVFKGRVLDCDTSDPIWGVSVEAWNVRKEGWLAKSDEDFIGRATTGADGRFILELPGSSSTISLLLLSKSYGSSIEEAWATTDGYENIFHVGFAFAVEGFVFDPEGWPVPDASVLAVDYGIDTGELSPAMALNRDGVSCTRTDSMGFYRIETLSSCKSYRMLAVGSDGFRGEAEEDVDFSGETPGVPVRRDIRIEAKGILVVNLIDFAEGRAESTVMLARQVVLENGEVSFEAAANTVTNEEGRARFRNLREGVYKIAAWPAGRLPFERVERVADKGVTVLNVKLEKGGELAGTVLDKSGRPVDQAYVVAWLESAKSPMIHLYTDDQSARDGTFRIAGIPDGKLSVSVRARGFIETLYPSQCAGHVRFVLAAAPVLRVDFGKSIAERAPSIVHFEFYGAGFLMTVPGNIDPEGRASVRVPFSYNPVRSDEVDKLERRCRCICSFLEHSSFWYVDLGEHVLRPDQILTAGAAVEIGTRTVEGRVADKSGKPIGGALVSIRSDGDIYMRQSVSPANGAFSFHDLPRIPAWLTVECSTRPGESMSVPPDSIGPLEVRLLDGAAIQGSVRDEEGFAVDGFGISISAIESSPGSIQPPPGVSAEITGPGSFSYGRLRPGSYRVTVTAKGPKKEIDVTLADGETKNVEFRFP